MKSNSDNNIPPGNDDCKRFVMSGDSQGCPAGGFTTGRASCPSEDKQTGKNSSPFSISVHKKTEIEKNKYVKQVDDSNIGVSLFDDGVRVTGVAIKGTPSSSGKNASKRKEISDFSVKSRRRLRETMLTLGLPDDLECAGITLTLPGPNLPPEYVKKLWNEFQVNLRRLGCCAIWRREQQERGQLHWHLIAGLPDRETAGKIKEKWFRCLENLGMVQYGSLSPVGGTRGDYSRFHGFLGFSRWHCGADWVVGNAIVMSVSKVEGFNCVKFGIFGKSFSLWFSPDSDIFDLVSLSADKVVSVFGNWSVREIKGVKKPVCTLGGVRETLPENWPESVGNEVYGGLSINSFPDLSSWWGCDQYAVKVDFQEPSGAWKRYLQDHTSKSKQEQVANYGRHWGVINRGFFIERKSAGDVSFPSQKEFHRFLRVFRRLRTPQVKCPKAPFGKKLGFPPGGGGTGSRVWFSSPETVKRLALWAGGYLEK